MDRQVARSFEELHIYQRARKLTGEIYTISRAGKFANDPSLTDQIRRASVSVMSNIAEGFERGSKAEFIQFLFISKGSCGEVRAQLDVVHDQGYAEGSDCLRLRESARQLGAMISNFIKRLQESKYQGAKAAFPKRRAAEEMQRRQEELRRIQLVNIMAASTKQEEGKKV